MPGLNLERIYMYYGNTFDIISPTTKVCLLSENHFAVQSKKAVMFTLQVRRYCLSDFQGRIVIRVSLIALIFSMTQSVFTNVYCNGGQMLPALVQNFNIIRTTASLKLCLSDAIHNFKWVKIIQIWQNGGKLFFKSCWLMSHFILNIFKMWYLMC